MSEFVPDLLNLGNANEPFPPPAPRSPGRPRKLSFVDELKAIRAERKLSKEKVARAIGISLKHYQAMEWGAQSVSIEIADRLRRFFGVRLNWRELKSNRRDRLKYVIRPGWITCPVDGETAFVSADELIMLYGVSREECLIEPPGGVFHGMRGSMILLEPSVSGAYDINLCPAISVE